VLRCDFPLRCGWQAAAGPATVGFGFDRRDVHDRLRSRQRQPLLEVQMLDLAMLIATPPRGHAPAPIQRARRPKLRPRVAVIFYERKEGLVADRMGVDCELTEHDALLAFVVECELSGLTFAGAVFPLWHDDRHALWHVRHLHVGWTRVAALSARPG